MWFGIHLVRASERTDGGDPLAIVHVYQRDRCFTVAGAPESVPDIITVLRLAAYDSALALPYCRTCHARMDVPDVDGLEAECASA